MGKEQDLLEAARNCTLPVVKRILNHKIKKIGNISRSNDKTAKSGFSRSQESILDGFSASTSHTRTTPSYIDYDTPPPVPPRDILPLTRASKSVDSGPQSHPLTIFAQSSVNGGDTYGYESIKRNHHQHNYRDDLRLDGQTANSTWSYHSLKRTPNPGSKPLPPAKPPRKPLSANRDFSHQQQQQQYYSKNQHHLHQQQPTPSSSSSSTLTTAASKRNSSFDYVSDSGLGSSETCMKRSLSNDGGDYLDGRTFCNNQRLSTFLGPEKPPLPSEAPNIYENVAGVGANSHSKHLMSESALSRLYDEIASETSGMETNSSMVSSVNSIASLDHIYAEPRRSVKDNFHQQHIRSKSEHHPRCPNYEEIQGIHEEKKETSSNEPKPNKSKRATVQIPVNFKSLTRKSSKNIDPPSPEMALEGITAVIEPLYKPLSCNQWTQDAYQEACIEILPPENCPDQRSRKIYTLGLNCYQPYYIQFNRRSDPSDLTSEHLKFKNPRYHDMETSTDDNMFLTTDSDGKQVYVKLRNSRNRAKLENKNVATENETIGVGTEDNPFQELCRGSVSLRRSDIIPQDGRKSLRRSKNLEKSTLERRKKKLSLSSRSKSEKSLNDKATANSNNLTTIEIKPIELEMNGEQPQSPEANILPSICFDENKEWAEIADIMASFGSDLTRSTDELTQQMQEERLAMLNRSFDDWLKEYYLHDYANLLTSNGFDDVQFMGPNVMEEGDLIEIGITNADDRNRLLEAARNLPKLGKLSKDEQLTVDQWLSSLKLDQYSDNFKENGFVDMDKVRKIWDVELNAVIEINKIGHRKRILASLGERLSLISDLSLDDLDFNKLNFGLDDLKMHEDPVKTAAREPSEPKSDINSSRGFDYESDRTSISSDIRPDSVNSTTTNSNRSSTHLSTPLSSQWKHDPIELYKGECQYRALYLGSTLVTKLQGIQSTKESIKKLKESTKDIQKIPTVILAISYTGVKFIDAQTDKMVCEHEIRNIHCACQDADDFKHFAYITKEHETSNHYCHVFCAQSLDIVTEIILTLGQAFEVAYKIALGEEIEMLRKHYLENQMKAPSPPPRSTSYSLSQGTSWDDSSTNVPSSSGEETSTLKITKSSSPQHRRNFTNNFNNTSKSEPPTDLISSSPSPTPTTTARNISKPLPIGRKPMLRAKPDVPTKPPSLIKSCASPASTLQRKSK